MTNIDILGRLVAAFAIGAVLGINRDLHKKAAGVRTIGLVSIASAMMVMAAGGAGPGQPGFAEVTRIIQGVLTGVGFIGAGVIVRGNDEGQVHGLTTAAVIWLAAGFGVLCGLGAWIEVTVALALVFVLLIGGGPAERLIHRVLRGSQDGAGDPPHGGDASA
jgi:putative Mg2+ transporter-C (MgtC) family protein